MSTTLDYAREVRCTRVLGPASLSDLVHGNVEVIHVEGYWDTTKGGTAVDAIRRACEDSEYTLTSDLQSLATSVGDLDARPELRERYFQDARYLPEQMRNEFFASLPNPMETFRAQIDEYWPHGAHIARVDGQMMLPAIVRRWKAGGLANPHIDQCSVPVIESLSLKRRIGVNIYLSMPEPPETGGEIEFWGRIDEGDYAASKRSDYGLDKAPLGMPKLVVRPDPGDLIMFDAAQIHGVRALTGPDRISLATFVGYVSDDEPLVLFA